MLDVEALRAATPHRGKGFPGFPSLDTLGYRLEPEILSQSDQVPDDRLVGAAATEPMDEAGIDLRLGERQDAERSE